MAPGSLFLVPTYCLLSSPPLVSERRCTSYAPGSARPLLVFISWPFVEITVDRGWCQAPSFHGSRRRSVIHSGYTMQCALNVIYDLYICNQQHHPAEIGKKRYVMRTFKERTRIVEVHWPYQCHVFSLFRVILTYGLGAQ